MQKNYINYFVAITVYLLFISNTLNVFVNNYEYNFTFSVLATSLLCFIAFYFFYYMILILIKKIVDEKYFFFVVLFIFFLSLNSTINPNIASETLNLKVIFFINIFLSFVMAIISLKLKLNKFFLIASSVTILVSTLNFFYIIFTDYNNFKKNNIDNNFLVSNNSNIFVISFDNLSSTIIEKEYYANKKNGVYKDFIFYDNYISIAQSTDPNILFEINGYNNLEKTIKLNKNKIINKIAKNEYNIVNRKDIKANLFGSYNLIKGKDTLINFTNLSFIDFGILSFERYIIPSLERLFTYKLNFFYSKNIKDKFFFRNKQSLKQYKFFLNNLSKSSYTDEIVVNMGHWIFTHEPISLNQNCVFIQNIDQKISNMHTVGKCVTNLFEKFINILKDKKIYNNSTIIFKSDTGNLTNLFPKSNILSSTKGKSIYGYSLYRPFLMIKPFNSKKIDDKNSSIITTYDLATFYCNQVNFSNENKSKIKCDNFGEKYLYNTIYENKNFSNREFNIFYDNNKNSHLMDESELKLISIKNGNIDTPFINLFNN